MCLRPSRLLQQNARAGVLTHKTFFLPVLRGREQKPASCGGTLTTHRSHRDPPLTSASLTPPQGLILKCHRAGGGGRGQAYESGRPGDRHSEQNSTYKASTLRSEIMKCSRTASSWCRQRDLPARHSHGAAASPDGQQQSCLGRSPSPEALGCLGALRQVWGGPVPTPFWGLRRDTFL